MTFRIDRIGGPGNLKAFSITGKITGEHVETLRKVLQQESGVVVIDLEKVSLVDRQAIRLLALIEKNGAELRNCPAYIREWVTRERADDESGLI